MNKKAFLLVAIVGALGLASCSGTLVVSQSSSADSSSQSSSSEAESEFEKWKKSTDATDYDGDGKIDEKDYAVFLWLESDDARDFDGDRKINYADYAFLEGFKTWKKSVEALDCNGDFKIDFEDYLLYRQYLVWKESSDSADFDGNGVIDYEDYLLYLPFAKWLAGDGAIDIDGDGTINYSDYMHSSEFNAWRAGSDSRDYDENGTIDYADFVRYNEFNAWRAGSDARDYDENGVIDYDDYLTHLAFIAWKSSDQATDIDGDSEITYEDYVASLQPSGDKKEYNLPEGDPASEVTITFWQCLGHEKSANLQNIVDAFNAKWKGKYKVNSVKVAGSYDALAAAIKTKLSQGIVPALAMGYPNSFSSYMTNDIANSWIYPLDNFINNPNDGYSEPELADFVPEFLNEGKNYHFAGTWSMPMYKSTELMYYNASYMAGANEQNKHKFANNAEFNTLVTAVENATSKATDEQLKALKDWVVAHQGYAYDVPVKWDDMISLARKMVADRKAEGITGEFYPVGYDSDANMLISQFAQRGIPYTVNSAEANEDPELHYVFNNAQAKTFVQEIVNNINDKLLITQALLGGSKYTNELFTIGQCAMTVGSTGGSSYNVSANFAVRLAPVPYHGDTPKYIQQGPSICFFGNRDPFVHKGAWLFYKAMAEGQANAELALANSYDPIRNSSYESDSYKQFIARHADATKYDIPYHTKDLRQYYMTSPVFPGSDVARVEIGNVLSYAIFSKLGVDGALQKAYTVCCAK